MSKLTQKEAVFQAVNKFGTVENNQAELTSDQRNQVVDHVVEGFQEGTVDMKDTESNREKLNNPEKLKSYVVGMVSNWLRKDTRLNGGEKYEIQNPGSRAGSSDPQIKAMRQLIKKYEEGTEEYKLINDKIQARLVEIKPNHEPTIDFSSIPAELLEDLGIEEEHSAA